MPATTQATSYRWGSLTPNALYFNNNKVWPTSLWTETFSAGDSATWPAPWAHTSKPATASASVAAGIGTLKYGTVGNWDGNDTTVMLRDVSVANYEATLRIRIADVHGTLAAVICRVPAAWNDGGTGIHVNFNPGDVTLRVEETVSWTGTLIGSAPLSQASGTWYRLRIRLSGTSVQVRAWPDGQAEPGSWSVSGTAPSVTAAGRIGVRAGGGAAAADRKVDVDDWNIVAL